MNNAAAIILCAGKGTRMNDDSRNKVCFDCAGIPVIRRIIDNMKKGGVSRFVIVIGHSAYSVMDCLDGVDGVVYAYQKEQKGTGHAALCGLKALHTVGYTGPVIVSMGDKIIAPDVIAGLLEKAGSAKAVWGVQPLAANPMGGRVVTENGRPFGVVELADAALLALAGHEPEEYGAILAGTGLNPKKAEKVRRKAEEMAGSDSFTGEKLLSGRSFTAEQILHTPYANAGLYCFDAEKAAEVVSSLGSDNAQGEVYLTDALEVFAGGDDAALYEVKSAEDMLTYSTKSELREMSRHFLKKASAYREEIVTGAADERFFLLYREKAEAQKKRYLALLDQFIETYGDREAVITRAPGRVNLMGRHIDHRGGGINVMAIDRDAVLICAPREDDRVRMVNTDARYPERSFSVGEELSRADSESWLGYLEAESVKNALAESRGDWSNYVKSAVLRASLSGDPPLCGMDLAADGCIPAAAGLSSSSAMVVAVMEAVTALNCLNLTEKEFIELCGEGEWFVGSRGGAGDHAAMKCGKRGRIIHLGFKPFTVGSSAAFSDRYAVLVANSMVQAKKSEGSRDTFNAKVAAYEFSFLLLKKAFPEAELREFRDLAAVKPYSRIYEMLKAIPETADRETLRALLPEYRETAERIFSTHADPGRYDLRGVVLYGVSECARAERFMELLESGDYAALGRSMKISHDGDRLTGKRFPDELLEELAEKNADPALETGAYGCSTEQIDGLCDLLNAADGVLGSEIAGAGLGGCVLALIEKDKADEILSVVNEKYYDAHGYAHEAGVYEASCGSSVWY